MADYYRKELQLLPSSPSTPPPQANPSPSSVVDHRRPTTTDSFHTPPPPQPSLDLQLSISVDVKRIRQSSSDGVSVLRQSNSKSNKPRNNWEYLEAMKSRAAEETRLAAIERAYAARVQELSRREMEAAEMELSKARRIWERAKEEVEKAEKLKERAMANGIVNNDDTCMEITCHSCRHKFRP